MFFCLLIVNGHVTVLWTNCASREWCKKQKSFGITWGPDGARLVSIDVSLLCTRFFAQVLRVPVGMISLDHMVTAGWCGNSLLQKPSHLCIRFEYTSTLITRVSSAPPPHRPLRNSRPPASYIYICFQDLGNICIHRFPRRWKYKYIHKVLET